MKTRIYAAPAVKGLRKSCVYPANSRRSSTAVLMLAHRMRDRPYIQPALCQRLLFADPFVIVAD